MYRDASHLWRSFSHNRTKINIQFLNESECKQIVREPLRGSPALFVLCYDSFPHEPRKEDTHSLIKEQACHVGNSRLSLMENWWTLLFFTVKSWGQRCMIVVKGYAMFCSSLVSLNNNFYFINKLNFMPPDLMIRGILFCLACLFVCL